MQDDTSSQDDKKSNNYMESEGSETETEDKNNDNDTDWNRKGFRSSSSDEDSVDLNYDATYPYQKKCGHAPVWHRTGLPAIVQLTLEKT
jgi:hypothetical protein